MDITAPATQVRGVAFKVLGTPAPQGSKRAFVVKGRAVLTEDSKKTKPWRDSVATAAQDAMEGLPIDGPVAVTITFYFARPKSVRRPYPSVAPDIDKLERTILDGLQAGGVITDDARVVDLTAKKRYADTPSADITVIEVTA